MSSNDVDAILYSCQCLNIRLRTRVPDATPPQDNTAENDSQYTQAYVGDEGVTIAHPHVTLRTRTHGIPITGTSRFSRYTTISCLICQQEAVYRVYQVISLDVEGKDGPMLPTDDWVEAEIMRSSNGWIQVHKDCLMGDAITLAQSSPSYSLTFNLVLPSSSNSHFKPSVLQPPSESPSKSPPPPPSYLSHMRPLFLPAPFTPSHPVFIHLASYASNKSQQLRASTEEYISEIVKQQIAEVERSEAELVRQVEILWRRFREGLNKVEQDRSLSRPPAPRDRSYEPRSPAHRPGSPTEHGLPVTVRDFVPIHVPIARQPPSRSIPRISTLSASLASSTFHHPRAQPGQQEQFGDARPPSYVSNGSSPASSSSHTLSSQTGASLTDGSNVLGFKRNTNDTINTAASFRYFVDLEADMARHKRERGQATEQNDTGRSSQSPAVDGGDASSHTNGKAVSTNGGKKHSKKPSLSEPVAQNGKAEVVGEGSGSQEPENEPKGKRKVTFDIKPAVVTITREVKSEKEEEDAQRVGQETGEMIFDLEEDGSEGSFTSPKPMLPFIEQPSRPRRVSHQRAQSIGGLPSSLASLRPTSLPAPSHIRPSRNYSDGEPTMTQILQPLPRSYTDERPLKANLEPVVQDEEQPLEPHEVEILKLVAANTPSHRGAWTRDSKAWKTFVRRHDSKEVPVDNLITEEAEGDDGGDGLVSEGVYHYTEDDESNSDDLLTENRQAEYIGSLPISVPLRSRPKEELSLASYQPKAALIDRPKSPVSALQRKSPKSLSSAVARRKAAYAERDISRSMDPGAFDFVTEHGDDDDDESSSDDVLSGDVPDVADRGRKFALKILQKRNQLPAAGMWRSLA